MALKALMAVTGLCLIAFLLMHMYGNLKVFMGPEAFNHYAEWLKGDIFYPLFPKGSFIWIFRAFMVFCLVAHVTSAVTLWNRAHKARPASRKYATVKRLEQTYSARTMRWGGVILGGALIFHLLQFTVKAITTGFDVDADPYTMVISSFSMWWMVAFYAVWLVSVCMHVRHGFWSAFTTLGANVSEVARKVLNWCAYAVAILLYFGFMIMPVAVLMGFVK